MSFESRLVLDEVSHLFTGYDGNSPDVSGFTGKARVYFELPDIVAEVVDEIFNGVPWQNVTDKWELSGYNANPDSTAGLTFIIEDPLYVDEKGMYRNFKLENVHNQWITEGFQHFTIKAERSWPFGDKFAVFTAYVSRLESDILGCMDPEALNYNKAAEVDDGSCEYSPPPPPVIESDEGRAADGPVGGIQVEYTTDPKPLNDILPITPLVYDGEDLTITLDLRNITYKPKPLAEIMNPEFKSY
jgi:hypothetical protein